MDEREALKKAIEELEARRPTLGDSLVDSALAPLRARLGLLDSPPRAEAERKMVTALFADFAGFTHLVATRDPEKVRELVGAAFSVLVPVIEKFGGTIEKFIGDGVMALFGAPTAHEDDPRRACLASLDMRDALAVFNSQRGEALALHSGIGTGIVVAGSLGPAGHSGYSAVGSAVNRAARIASLARGGEIIVDAETAARAGEDFSFHELEPRVVKGFEEAIRLFLLARERDTARTRGAFLPFLGREPELAAMHAAWSGAGSPSTLILLRGEAGIGKSRLAREWLDQLCPPPRPPAFGPAATGGAGSEAPLLVEARASSYEAASAHRLWSGLLERLAGILPEDGRTVQEARLSGLFENLGIEGETALLLRGLACLPPLPGEDEFRREAPPRGEELALALAAFLRGLARGRALVFVCEDFQYCDGPSAELLHRLLSLPFEASVCWLLITRETWPRLSLASQPPLPLLELALKGLGDADLEALAAACGPGAATPEAFRSRLAGAGGNPLFVEEILRQAEGGSWSACGEEAAAAAPGGVSPLLFSLVTARVDALSAEAREAVRMASILGDSFPRGLLETLVEGRGIGELLGGEIFLALPEEGRLGFRQGLFREAVLGTVIEKSRRAMHGRAARAIKEGYPEYASRRPEMMAIHYEGAGEARRALPYFQEAGDALYWRRAWPEAAAFLGRGLALARESLSPIHEAEFLALLGRCRQAMGETETALGCFDEALAIYRSLSNGSRVGAVLRSKAYALARAGRGPEAIQTLRQALGLAVETGSLKDRAKISADLSERLREAGEAAEALALAETTLALAELIKDASLYRRTLFSMGESLEALGRLPEARAAFKRCAYICRLSGEEKYATLAEARAASGASGGASGAASGAADDAAGGA
jgi:class 3 adenylate cyclase/tetratricopeptide (TPR) repeat protein